MPKAYSADMRGRVIAEVEGGASRREAAEEFQVSASTAIIWVKCFRETGRCAAKPRGGSVSPLDKHDFQSGRISAQFLDQGNQRGGRGSRCGQHCCRDRQSCISNSAHHISILCEDPGVLSGQPRSMIFFACA